nr:zinc finger, CCHC-type [Tanacetum cinerariifolium]
MDDTVEAIRRRAKWVNDDYIYRGHILNGMSNSLFNVYQNIESTKELWDSLKSKYITEDASSKKFLENNSGSGSNKKPRLEYWKCGKTGHFKRDYHSGNKKNANLVVRERVLRTNPTTKVDAISWWIDSSAITHICKYRCWFKIYEPVEDRSLLYMGDDHFGPVHGRGSCGYKHVYESDKYVLSKSGHVYYKRMLEMSKDDLIPIIDVNTKNTTFEGSRDQVRSQYSYCYSIEEDPRTYDEAMQSRDAAFWKKVINDEIGSIMENNTWVLSDLPPGCKPVGCKWIFKRKIKVDGTIDKFKARLIIQSFRQKEGIV